MVRSSLLIVGSLVLLLLGYFQFTLVSGVELNKRSWNLRKFSFRRDPFTNLQFGGIAYDVPSRSETWSANPIALQAELDPLIAKYLKGGSSNVPQNGRKDWDVVNIGSFNPDGDAQILVDILSAYDTEFHPFWPTWSQDNPKRAAVFWPVIRDLVHFSLYQRLPELFEMALALTSDEQFERRLIKSAGRSLREFELRSRSRGQSDLADAVKSVSAKYPD